MELPSYLARHAGVHVEGCLGTGGIQGAAPALGSVSEWPLLAMPAPIPLTWTSFVGAQPIPAPVGPPEAGPIPVPGMEVVVGRLAIDAVGAVLLAGACAAAVAFLLLCAACQWAAQRGRMACAAAGALRLAAARGDLRSLTLLARCRHFNVDEHLEGFTALLAASVECRDGGCGGGA